MKFLMIGLGSIGQRHLRNIKRLYGDNAEISAYRVRRLRMTFSDNMQIRDNVDLEKEYNITVYTSLDEALAHKPDVVFVSNVTSAHIPCALAAAKSGCHVFLEKPISDSMDGVDELKKTAEEKNVKIFVGFQNRYNPAIIATKKQLEMGTIGEVISVHAEVGERLTTMHTYEDYKTTYMARSDLGGGVVLNQMIHEIDYLRYLFGDMKPVNAVFGSGKKSLDIDVDDRCDAIFRAGDVLVSLHADFYQFPPCRFVKIVGSKGKIIADIIKNKCIICIGDEVTEQNYDGFARNDMFISELKAFMQCIENDTSPEITLDDGIASLKLALNIKLFNTEI